MRCFFLVLGAAALGSAGCSGRVDIAAPLPGPGGAGANAGDTPSSSSGTSTAPLYPCNDGTGNNDCCPPDAADGLRCPGPGSCWTACSSSGWRTEAFCGSAGVWVFGHGLFACIDSGAIGGSLAGSSSGETTSGSAMSTGASSGPANGDASAPTACPLPAPTMAPPTWTQLYAAYFGNPATGGCGSTQQICHQAATDTGVTLDPPRSNFVCGVTAASCYKGMFAAGMIGPQYSLGCAVSAPLYAALYKGGRSGGTTSDNMPQTLGYTFTSTDLDAIRAWLAAGAPEN